MLSILGFLAVLGPLVIVHEFGHYLFARLFGVKAEVFAIGFGPRVWGRRIGETDWRIAAIPLGGYVKLLGEDGETEITPELKSRTLQSKPVWQRFFIFFGGPLFNFLFAIVVFAAILVIGEPQMANVVGRVVRGSAAETAGFRSGDRILAVDGQPVRKFEEIYEFIHEKPGQELAFTVERKAEGDRSPGAPFQLRATPVAQAGFSIYGEATDVGDVPGLIPVARASFIGVSDPNSAAARAGLVTGEKVISLNDQPVADWETFEARYAMLPAGAFSLRVEPKEKGEAREISLEKPAVSSGLPGSDLGLHSSELFVEKAMPDTPAEKAGIKNGDRLVSVSGTTVPSFIDLREAVQKASERDGQVVMAWEREGKMMSATIKPNATSTKDAALKKVTQFTIGVTPQLAWAEPETMIERVWNPVMLFFEATKRMVVFSWRNFVSIGKMVTGEVSIGTLGGPILIGKIAGESLDRGLISFLTTMAMLSVGLGVLNILPIPVLDGGHLVLLLIEGVRGRPLSVRQTEIIQQVGFSLIVLLMVVVMRNDIMRLPFFNK